MPQTIKRKYLSHYTRAHEGFFGGVNQFLNLLTPELFEDEQGMPYEPGKKPKGLPGSEELHAMTKEKTGKYLEPKGEFTKITQEISSDIGSMFSTGGLGLLAKFVLPFGGQAIKQSIKGAGGSEKAQEIGKIGFMSIASMAGIGNAPRVASHALNEAERLLPRGLSFSSQPTERALNRIRNSSWFRTGRTPSKGPAMDEINRIENAIQNGRINGHDAMQLRRDINEARRQLGGFQLNRPVNRRQALRYLDNVDNALMQSMEHYGNRFNPRWLDQYRLANEAFRVTQRSRLISDVVNRIGKPFKAKQQKYYIMLEEHLF